MRNTFVLFCLLSTASAYAQTEVSNYLPGKNSEGVTYYLPKTSIEITVTAEKTTYTPGDFCKYAEKYLRLRGISTKASEEWVIKSVALKPVGTPDKEKMFTIKLKDKTVAPLVEQTKDGIIKAINTSYPETAEDVAEETTDSRSIDPRSHLTEDILMSSSTAKMAELTAKEIYNIRESKNAITRGQAESMPKDGESLKIMLNNLDEQEQALLLLFTGTTTKETESYSVKVTPEDDIDKQVVVRFSRKLGLVAANDLSGSPIYLSLTNQHTVPQATEEEKAKKKLEGVVYNVPGKATISVNNGNKNIYKGECSISQFGNTEVLSSSLFNKKSSTTVLFDPTTGGLVKIEVEE